MALSAVVFPAPFGPISPRMRPSSMRRLTRSSATVAPKVLRRSRASMQGMLVVPFCFCLRGVAEPGEEFFRAQAESADGGGDSGPLFSEESLAFSLEEV